MSTYVQLDNVSCDLLEEKGIDGAFDPNVFTVIVDGDDSAIHDIDGQMTIQQVLSEAVEGDRIVVADDCPPSVSIPGTQSKGYWRGETVYTV